MAAVALCLVVLAAPVALAAIGSCPSNFVPVRNLVTDRAACTAACGDLGYCCTNDNGGCQRPTCSAGCLFAWFADSQAECEAECSAAVGNCWYTHAESDEDFAFCFGHESCGCPSEGDDGYDADNLWGSSNDCSGPGCEAACELAVDLQGVSFYGRELTDAELAALDASHADAEDELHEAMSSLASHVQGDVTLSADELSAAAATVVEHALVLRRQGELIEQALDLVDAYEAGAYGPMFTEGGEFQRSGTGDGRDTDRAMLLVQQVLLDYVYNGGIVHDCSRELFDGRGWQTADYYPGAAAPPADPSVVHAVTVDAFAREAWGVPVAFAGDHAVKPTGLYLSPGQLAEVTAPAAMVGAGYKVLVGGNTVDNHNKNTHKRMDRVTATFDMDEATTLVANPLGGGVYILVPPGASLGPVELQLTGGVVAAPLFQRTNFRTMSNSDWLDVREAPGPWAVFESDKFMLNVPSAWVYAMDDPLSLLEDYNLAMDGAAEWLGYPIEHRVRGPHMLYLQPDLHIKHGAYGIGYPQVNTLFSATQTYNGNHGHWLVTNPTGWAVCYHEMGHAQLMSMYRGEVEAINNYMMTYIRHVKFCDDFATAFNAAQAHTNYEPDEAAVHWMITPNFRDGNEMDHSNTEYDEFRYQDRGFAKYADITRLFGWEAFTSFYHQENLDYNDGVEYHSGSDGLHAVDSRTLRLSEAAGADLTPLIHFWGIFPVDAEALSEQIAAHGLSASTQVRCLLLRYKELIPTDNAAFNEFFEKIHPGRPSGGNPLYGLGWYNAWRDVYDASHGQAARQRVDAVLSLYFSGSVSCDGVNSGEADVPRPTSFSWQSQVWNCDPLPECTAAPGGSCTSAPRRWGQSRQTCEANEQRLCSRAELLGGACGGTACGGSADDAFVWSGTACGSNRFWKVRANGGAEHCKHKNSRSRTRCCLGDSDAPDVVCTAAAGGSCRTQRGRWTAARDWCEEAGQRLCSMEELMDGACSGSGCSGNGSNKWVWSQSSCAANKKWRVRANGSARSCKHKRKRYWSRCCSEQRRLQDAAPAQVLDL